MKTDTYSTSTFLGSQKLVRTHPSQVRELYGILDSLNVHEHDAFTTIVFSDTALVYNRVEPASENDHAYLVMYACEFAQDLLYRTIGTGVYFRAVLLHGEFHHEVLENIQSFYGSALIDAYELEKQIPSAGLFIHETCIAHNKIFPVSSFNAELSFVYLTQTLDTLQEYSGGHLPLKDGQILEETDIHWRLAFDVRMLEETYAAMRTHEDPRVGVKFLTIWDLYMRRYPELLANLVAKRFALEAITPAIDWTAAAQRVPR